MNEKKFKKETLEAIDYAMAELDDARKRLNDGEYRLLMYSLMRATTALRAPYDRAADYIKRQETKGQ